MKHVLLFAISLCVSAGDASLLRRFYLNADIRNKVCDNSIAVFGTIYAPSLARCALWCKKLNSCASFFYSPATSTCVGCNKIYTSRVQLTGNMGGSLYYSSKPIDRRGIRAVLSGCYRKMCGSTICPSTDEVSSNAMTKDWCLAYCRGPFGVQQNRCYCNFLSSVKQYGCSYSCAGNSREICGGANGVTLYKFAYV